MIYIHELTKLIAELHSELENIGEAIRTLEALASPKQARRGRPRKLPAGSGGAGSLTARRLVRAERGRTMAAG